MTERRAGGRIGNFIHKIEDRARVRDEARILAALDHLGRDRVELPALLSASQEVEPARANRFSQAVRRRRDKRALRRLVESEEVRQNWNWRGAGVDTPALYTREKPQDKDK